MGQIVSYLREKKRGRLPPLPSLSPNPHPPSLSFPLFFFSTPSSPPFLVFSHLTSQQQSELTERWETIEAGSVGDLRGLGGRDRREAQAKNRHPSGVSRLALCCSRPVRKLGHFNSPLRPPLSTNPSTLPSLPITFSFAPLTLFSRPSLYCLLERRTEVAKSEKVTDGPFFSSSLSL